MASAPPPALQGRFYFLDGLRGYAAISIALFHFYMPRISPIHDQLEAAFPWPLEFILTQGFMGIEVFFVLSGFVIAYSMRNDRITARFTGTYMLSRVIRLAPAFYAVLLIVIVGTFVLDSHGAPYILETYWWGLDGIAVNMLFLSDLAGYPRILGVSWTLYLTMQFYLASIAMLGIARKLSEALGSEENPRTNLARLVVFAPIALISLAVWITRHRYNFIGLWYMFFAGMLLYWTLAGEVKERWLWAFGAVLFVLAIHDNLRDFVIEDDHIRAMKTFTAGSLIYLAGRRGALHLWLRARWIQYFGKISYSLYLLHSTVGFFVIDTMLRRRGDSMRVAVIAFVAAFAFSVAAADLMHRFVVAPSVRFSAKFRPRKTLNRAGNKVGLVKHQLEDAPCAVQTSPE